MSKRFVLILAVCIAVFAGLLVLNKNDSDNQSGEGGNNNASVSNHTVGEGTAGVTLTEYGDFQCPACYQYFPLIKALKEKYGDQIKFQFRHFPLTEIHQNALISSRAAEAAGLQGKFFEMHDLLYGNQQSWVENSNPSQVFDGFATQLGLDVNKFREDIKSEAVNDTVQADRAEAKRLGYSSTPTFEINGSQIENPRDLDGFVRLIDEAIKEKSQPTQGTENQ